MQIIMDKSKTSLVLLLVTSVLAAQGVRAQTAAATNATASAPKAPAKPTDVFGDKVIAKGTNVEVKRSQLDEEVIRIKANATRNGQTVSPEQTTMLEQQILGQAILVQLLNSKSTDTDKTEGKTQAEKKLQEGKTQFGSDEALDRQLKAAGVTRAELLKQWAEAATAESVLKRELKVSVTDDDVKKFYDDNPSKFEQAETVRAAHILIKTTDAANAELSQEQKDAKRKQAQDILKRARAGEDFGKLAKEFSEDPGSKENGGEYTFPRGQMVAEFETAAFSMNTNQISDLVTTKFGYHIIKLLEKMPAKKTELAAVGSRIKDFLTQEAIKKQLPDYYKKLRKDAKVEILDEKLKPQEEPEGMPATVAPSTNNGKADKKK